MGGADDGAASHLALLDEPHRFEAGRRVVNAGELPEVSGISLSIRRETNHMPAPLRLGSRELLQHLPRRRVARQYLLRHDEERFAVGCEAGRLAVDGVNELLRVGFVNANLAAGDDGVALAIRREADVRNVAERLVGLRRRWRQQREDSHMADKNARSCEEREVGNRRDELFAVRRERERRQPCEWRPNRMAGQRYGLL